MTADEAIDWLRSTPTTAPEGRIVLDELDGVATLWLDHDACRNALTTSMMAQLAEHVRTLQAAPPKMWLLRARGRAFCAGGHLGDVRATLGEAEAGRRMATVMGAVLERLEALPSVGVVVVHGAAVGGGAELAVLGDLCVVQHDAVVHFAQADRGVACGWGGATRLVDRIGPRRAVDVLLLRPEATAQRLSDLGLAVCAEDAAAFADRLAQRIRALDRSVVRAAIDAVRGRSSEVDAFASVWGQSIHHQQLAGLPWGRP